MPTDELIIGVFCMIDADLGAVKKHSQAKLHPSEVVTLMPASLLSAVTSQPTVTFDAVHLDDHGHSGGGHEAGQTHDLVVSKKLADGSYEVVGRTPEIATGESTRLTVDLEPGEYQLSCDLVEEVDGEMVSHTVEGMVANLQVRE